MEQATTDRIMKEYDEKIRLYTEFGEKLKLLIRDIIKAKKQPYHSITFRPKEKTSLSRKISKPESEYAELADITDIAGLRIITYFGDDVDKIAQMIEEEFDVDRENTIDKRLLLDPDRFGYLSLHYVISLEKGRAKLIEYAKFQGLKAEIQIRSILQHAWAEIEHDLDTSPL